MSQLTPAEGRLDLLGLLLLMPLMVRSPGRLSPDEEPTARAGCRQPVVLTANHGKRSASAPDGHRRLTLRLTSGPVTRLHVDRGGETPGSDLLDLTVPTGSVDLLPLIRAMDPLPLTIADPRRRSAR